MESAFASGDFAGRTSGNSLLLSGKINRRNTLEQMAVVGPESLIIALVTAVGMVFTIQVARSLSTLVPEA